MCTLRNNNNYKIINDLKVLILLMDTLNSLLHYAMNELIERVIKDNTTEILLWEVFAK